MAERKVLNKYYPPDYDPSKIPKIKRKNKQSDVRIMAPFNLRCSTCGNYIANATKFNAKKETVEDETYKNLMIYRFYIKCPRCMAPIIFRTDPKEKGYKVEHGATENFMALKMAERQAQEEAEAEEEGEKINPMQHLENRTKASKKQMEASEQIQQLRAIKYRHHTVNLDAIISDKRQESLETQAGTTDDKLAEDEQIRAEALKLLKRKAIESGESSKNKLFASSSSSTFPTKKKPFTSSLSCSKLSASHSRLKMVKVKPKSAIEGKEKDESID